MGLFLFCNDVSHVGCCNPVTPSPWLAPKDCNAEEPDAKRRKGMSHLAERTMGALVGFIMIYFRAFPWHSSECPARVWGGLFGH